MRVFTLGTPASMLSWKMSLLGHLGPLGIVGFRLQVLWVVMGVGLRSLWVFTFCFSLTPVGELVSMPVLLWHHQDSRAAGEA